MAKPLRFFWVFVFLPNLVFSQLDNFIYTGFHGVGNNNISMNGATKIDSNGVLELTNVTKRLIGRAFYPSPLRFKNSTDGTPFSFSTSFAFAIVPEYPKLGGHGLTFTISPTKEFKGALPSQYFGLFNAENSSNHIFAVEFDTVQELEFGDIDDNHVGIDINSPISNDSASAAYYRDGSTKKEALNLISGKTFQAWIDYDSRRNQLNVTLSPSSSKPSLPLLSLDLNLSTILNDFMYVGFSASTGLLVSSHYLFGWNFKMNGVAQNFDLSSLPSLPAVPKKKQTAALSIGVPVSVSATVLLISAILFSIYIIRKIKNADIIEEWELNVGPHRFSYQELKKATKNFRDKELLGFGGFGRVYRGTLPNSQTQVAVKRVSHESKQGLREFVSEIASIGRLRHRNLVQLQGWCRRRGDLLLVYDFMSNGSLDKFLFDDPKSILTWEQRFKIIKGVASGLLYLHEEWEQIVIHRDIKASNILLDGELNGRLGDFGLARLHEHGANPSTTRVVGTLGYIAPELTRAGKATTASDVFAFGALLLEVACGRRPVEHKASPEELILVDWIWEAWIEGMVLGVVDPRLMGHYDEVELVMVLKLGLMCSNNVPTARPSMRQVVRYLEGEVGVPDVLSPPGAYDRGKGNEGFDDFVHSYPSSNEKVSSEKVSSFSFMRSDDFDVEAASASPISLLSGRGSSFIRTG
ncbi:hypothetical protein HHK36_021223 [Tetracentron sinense]|uniref:non-specific serine/threonine protein kinase n=1 Tax=Tetracentron sinense TaxID=13715 RepID=A0A834YR39_TETSI|nr:hypothetical protein HHK36_021223 [Tetracentron sinense]